MSHFETGGEQAEMVKADESSQRNRALINDIVATFRQLFGKGWGRDEDATAQFSTDVGLLISEVDGAHLIGDPKVEDDRVTFTVWVDFPLDDLMTADQLAYDIFSRISEEIFYVERHFEPRAIRYPFVTGSAREGHIGALVLAGPNAADFADRHHLRATGGVRYHA